MVDLELWKKRKKELHLNYALIAEHAGVSKRSVEDIFRGYTMNPRIDTVQAIERALGLSNDITPEEYEAGWRDTATVQITPDEDDILDRCRELKQILGEKKGADLVKSLLDGAIASLKKP